MSPRARRTRTVAALALLMAAIGLAYWVPVLAALASGDINSDAGSGWGVRMARLAVRQFGPEMSPVALVLGTLLVLLSALQIPACLGTFALRRWGTLMLRIIALAKLGSYLTSAVIVLAAVLHYHHQGDADWAVSAATFATNVLVLLFYFWVAHSLTAPVTADEQA